MRWLHLEVLDWLLLLLCHLCQALVLLLIVIVIVEPVSLSYGAAAEQY